MQNIHDMSTFKPILYKYLSKEEHKLALSSLIFLKQKRNGYIKGRSFAYGLPERHTMKKEDITSLTVATESVLINPTIDAFDI